MTKENTVRTCLWFESRGLEAAKFYVNLIPGSELQTADTGQGEPMVVAFTLAGVPYQILNGGPHYRLNPACSIAVATPDQAETDRIWDALIRDGGEAGRCGWLVDRWGVSWQVFPDALSRLLGAADRAAAGRAQEAMMTMNKIDIGVMQAAFDAR